MISSRQKSARSSQSSHMFQRCVLLLILVVFSSSCARLRVPSQIEPAVTAPPHPKQIQRERRTLLCLPENFSCSPFTPLSEAERGTEWGKEYLIALRFAEDFDLYRAITDFKRALFFLPSDLKERFLEIEYCIALAYYLGEKYVEAVYAIESTPLAQVESDFPAFNDLLLILYDSYDHLGREAHAAHILRLIEQCNDEQAHKLSLLSAVKRADFSILHQESEECGEHPYLENILNAYAREAKSVKRAQLLNTLLPGAGYWYVGLKETAVTAFVINALFLAAGIKLLDAGHTAAGAIVLSLEGGWYFGGIAGAGYAAKHYNEQLYCCYASKIAQKEEYYPLFMLKYSF